MTSGGQTFDRQTDSDKQYTETETDLGDLEVVRAKRLFNAGQRVDFMRRVAEGGRTKPNQHASQIELTHLLIDFIHLSLALASPMTSSMRRPHPR